MRIKRLVFVGEGLLDLYNLVACSCRYKLLSIRKGPPLPASLPGSAAPFEQILDIESWYEFTPMLQLIRCEVDTMSIRLQSYRQQSNLLLSISLLANSSTALLCQQV